jgi:hypothetical protein
MAETFDLAILDASPLKEAVAYARCNSDIAVSRLNFGTALAELAGFRDQIDRSLRAKEKRPPVKDLTAYGHKLFHFCIQDDLAQLYSRLSAGQVRIHILSNQPELRAIPWEYWQEPSHNPGPRADRSVVRIVPVIGQPPPPPLEIKDRVRILFASAEPVDQVPVSWTEVRDGIESIFNARLNRIGKLEFKAIDGTTRSGLLDAVKQEPFDIFHFSGHGEVVKGIGHLVLTDRKTRKSSRLRADELGQILGHRGIRLAVLSACETAAGDFKDDFSVVAETLVRAGVPAVVANQLPIPDATVATFVEAMYRELLNSGDIDRAVGEGRISLSIDLGGSTDAVLEWGIPTIYRHIAAAQLLKP